MELAGITLNDLQTGIVV